MKIKLSHATVQAIQYMESLLKDLKSGKLEIVGMNTKRHTVMIDTGNVCHETCLGDVTVSTMTILEKEVEE